MSRLPDPLDHRKPDHPIEPIFLKRWSPRAMTGEPVTAEELNRLFEAARWAPSTYNEQEWRFLYAHRDTEHWKTFFDLLTEGNQLWCVNAGVLLVVLSHKVFERNGKPNPVHSFDSGSAFENLALQGSVMGLVVHGMAGFDRDKARRDLKVPDDYNVEAMVAIGRPGDPDQLPEKYREMDLNPTGRKKIEEFTREGPFQF
ncbi:MAG TPA: nitroreductase family protein [Gemmataceae bacterium]